MKKTFVILGLSLMIAACGGNAKTDTDSNDTTTPADNTAVIDTPATDTMAVTAEPEVKQPVAPVPAKPEVKKEEKAEAQQPAQATGSAKGGELIKKSDCLACHKEDVKLVGPAYKDVAKKYKPTEANINMLAGKVISGGAGNWGDIPMTPHPTISKSDAKEMVKYILALK